MVNALSPKRSERQPDLGALLPVRDGAAQPVAIAIPHSYRRKAPRQLRDVFGEEGKALQHRVGVMSGALRAGTQVQRDPVRRFIKEEAEMPSRSARDVGEAWLGLGHGIFASDEL